VARAPQLTVGVTEHASDVILPLVAFRGAPPEGLVERLDMPE
jgi:hypothetical protein